MSILVYFILPDLKKNKALRLISILLGSNVLLSIGYFVAIAAETSIIGTSPTSIWMNIFNITYSFGLISGINLTLVFSLNIYFEVYHKKSLDEFEYLMIASCFAIAATLTAFILYLPDPDYITVFFTQSYKISVMIMTTGLYIRVILAFSKTSYPDARQCMKDLAIYPLVGAVMLILFFLQQVFFCFLVCLKTYHLFVGKVISLSPSIILISLLLG